MIAAKDSVATRLLALTFSIYFLVALAVTAGHMKFEYDQAKQNILQDLKVFHTTFQPIMSQMVWSINRDALRKTVDGIAAAPNIAGVRIIPNGMDEVTAGTIVNGTAAADRELGLFGYEFPIIYTQSDGTTAALGKGIFYSSNAIVFQRVRYGFAVIILNALIKTTALWIIFSWLSNRLLRRPLAELTDAVRGVDFERLEHIRIELGTRRDNELKLLETAFNDMIDKLRAARLALCEANQSLEHKVSERTASLMDANRALEQTLGDLRATQGQLIQAEKMASLGQLVAGVAHELNTPIGNALVTASILEAAAKELEATVLRGELRKSSLLYYVQSNIPMVELISRSCARAADLIASFKQVAVDQTSEKRRRFDLAELVDDNVAALRPSYRRMAYRIECAIPAGIGCDSYPGPLGQVVANLVQNALVHGFDGREHGTLHITGRRDGERVELVFDDDGRGMASDVLKRIFEPFYTTRLGQGGSGLGLSIVLNIVTGMLGGTLNASSEAGRGTRITLSMPLTAPQQTDKAPHLA